MTRAFHAAAAAIMLAAAWLTLIPPAARATLHDPQAQLIGVLREAGLIYTGRRDIAQGEALLTFGQFGCAAQAGVIYMPWVSRMSPTAVALIAHARVPPVFVNDGEVVSGFSMTEVLPRWAWRRLLVLLRLRHDEPWTSINLAVLTPRGCALPPIDWARLPRG